MGAQRILIERADGKWGWQLIGSNGSDIIATDGGQGYDSEDFARKMADKIIGGSYAGAEKKIRRRS